MSERKRPATVREIIHALTTEHVDLDKPIELWRNHLLGTATYLSNDVHCRADGQSIDVEEFQREV